MSQIDTNACSNNSNKCSHFCFGLPNQMFSCQCPDNMSKSDGSCLCPGFKEPFSNGTCPSGKSIIILVLIFYQYFYLFIFIL